MSMSGLKRWLLLCLALAPLSACVTEIEGAPEMTDSRLHDIARARTTLAEDYYNHKQYSIALEQLAQAINADDNYSPAYNLRALVHVALLEEDEAVQDFKTSLKLDSANSRTRDDYGWYLCQRGKEREGVKHLVVAAKDPLYSGQAMAYLKAGRCALKINQQNAAELYLQRALILQPGLVEAHLELANLAYLSSDFLRARKNLRNYDKAVGGNLNAESLFLAVRIERRLGDRRAEAAYAARLKRQFPRSREAAMLRQLR